MRVSDDNTLDVFRRSIIQGHDRCKAGIASLISSLGVLTDLQIQSAVANALNNCEVLSLSLTAGMQIAGMVSPADYPAWLDPIKQVLRQFADNPAAPSIEKYRGLIVTLGPNCRAMLEHKWPFDSGDGDAIDFEAMYERYDSANQIPELYDKLIDELTRIVESGAIDNKKVVCDLETIIATLKRGRKDSRHRSFYTWQTCRCYLRHLIWNTLAEVRAVRIFTKSLRDTISEIDAAYAATHDAIQQDVSRKMIVSAPGIELTGLGLPALPAPSDEAVEDAEFSVIEPKDKKRTGAD